MHVDPACRVYQWGHTLSQRGIDRKEFTARFPTTAGAAAAAAAGSSGGGRLVRAGVSATDASEAEQLVAALCILYPWADDSSGGYSAARLLREQYCVA